VLAREWRAYLSPDEYVFLDYIRDLTVEWGRSSIDLTLDQMVSGVRAAAGSIWRWLVPPLGIPKRSLQRLINELRRKGALITEVLRNRCTVYRINMEWRPAPEVMDMLTPKRSREQGHKAGEFEGEISEEFQSAVATVASTTGPRVPKPKRMVAMATVAPAMATVATINGHGGVPIKQNEEQNGETPPIGGSPASGSQVGPIFRRRDRAMPEAVEPSSPAEKETPPPVAAAPSPVADAKQVVQALVDREKAEAAAKRREKAEEARKRSSTDAFEVTYRNAYMEAFPGIPVPRLTEKDQIILRSAVIARYKEPAEAHDFVDYCVRNWRLIIYTRFAHMRANPPPEMPKISFLTSPKVIGGFQDAFADKSLTAAIKLLPSDEREIARLMAAGLTYDAALRKAMEHRAASKFHTEKEKLVSEQAKHYRDREAARYRAAKESRQRQAEIAKLEAERKRLEAMQAGGEAPEAGFRELDNLPPLEFEPLPEIDLSKWN